MGIALATFLVGELPLILMSPRAGRAHRPSRSCGAACPANPALAVHAPNVADAFRNVEGVLQATWGVGLLFYLATRFAVGEPRTAPRDPSRLRLGCPPRRGLHAQRSGLRPRRRSVEWHGARDLRGHAHPRTRWGSSQALLLARAYAGEALTFMARKLVGRPLDRGRRAARAARARRSAGAPGLLAAAQRAVRRSAREPTSFSTRRSGDPHLARVRTRRRPGPGRRPRRRAERGSRAPGGRRGRLAAGARESPAGTRSARLGGRAARIPAAARGCRLGGAAEDRA